MMGENGCCQEDVKARIKFAIPERDKARKEKEEVIYYSLMKLLLNLHFDQSQCRLVFTARCKPEHIFGKIIGVLFRLFIY